MQDKAEAKLKTLEQRAQEQQKARLAADEEWRHQQREREMARLHVCHSHCHHCHCKWNMYATPAVVTATALQPEYVCHSHCHHCHCSATGTVVGRNATLRIRCPLTHCTLLQKYAACSASCPGPTVQYKRFQDKEVSSLRLYMHKTQRYNCILNQHKNRS